MSVPSVSALTGTAPERVRAEARPSAAPKLPAAPKLLVQEWPDPVIDELGHDPRSLYVETFWLSILGPSTTWLLRRLVAGLEHHPTGYQIDCATTSTELGLGGHTGKNSTLMRAVDRACRFGMAQRHVDSVYVRRHLPPLTARQVSRLPEHLKASHASWGSS